MSQNPEREKHPTVTDHPEQRRQEETGQEDASDATEVGRPPSQTSNPKKQEHAA
ncbi:MAG TPA: hypothetical protein VFE06_03105 [Acidobacteriaceae bacterium]|jgi:hypothetical protein|nr:hypothetical protein [Acidobacteriaceae bacterium]